MTAKIPTPQGISALLRRAGFERSNYGDKGVMWCDASSGYRVWKSATLEAPGEPVVAVQYWVNAAAYSVSDEEWRDHVRDANEKLQCYAADIEAAGFRTAIRNHPDRLPHLIVTPTSETPATEEG